MNNEIPLKLRLIATGTHMAGALPFILFPLLIYIIKGAGIGIWEITCLAAIMPIASLFSWRVTRDIHPFVYRSGRDAVNCALNTLLGTIASILFCTFIFSVTCGVGNQDPTLFFISLFILSCVELAYFMNSVIAGIFALRGYSFKSRLIYPFLKDD